MAYHGRKGPNVSQYISTLNAIPTAQDLQASDNLDFENDLALFTNTQFFDFDLGQDADLQQTFDGNNGRNKAESITVEPFDVGQGEHSSFTISATCIFQSYLRYRCYLRLFCYCCFKLYV